MHRVTVDDGIRPGEVDVLKQAQRGSLSAVAAVGTHPIRADDEHLARSEARGSALVVAFSRLERVGGQHHLLAGDEVVEVFVELVQVEGVDALVVVVALGIAGRVLAVDEVIVE